MGLLIAFRNSIDGTTSPLYQHSLHTSWLLPTWLLAALRTLIGIYILTCRFVALGYQDTQTQRRSFSYFTILGFWGLGCWFIVAAMHSWSLVVRNRRAAKESERRRNSEKTWTHDLEATSVKGVRTMSGQKEQLPWIANWPSSLKFAHTAFYGTVATFPWLVTAIYWGFLSDGSYDTQFSLWNNTSEHILNAVFAGLELFLPASGPIPWIIMPVLLVIMLLYLALAYVTVAVQGWYVYPFLEPSFMGGVWPVVGVCIAIALALFLIFSLVWALLWAKRALIERFSTSAVQTRDAPIMKTARFSTDSSGSEDEKEQVRPQPQRPARVHI